MFFCSLNVADVPSPLYTQKSVRRGQIALQRMYPKRIHLFGHLVRFSGIDQTKNFEKTILENFRKPCLIYTSIESPYFLFFFS